MKIGSSNWLLVLVINHQWPSWQPMHATHSTCLDIVHSYHIQPPHSTTRKHFKAVDKIDPPHYVEQLNYRGKYGHHNRTSNPTPQQYTTVRCPALAIAHAWKQAIHGTKHAFLDCLVMTSWFYPTNRIFLVFLIWSYVCWQHPSDSIPLVLPSSRAATSAATHHQYTCCIRALLRHGAV